MRRLLTMAVLIAAFIPAALTRAENPINDAARLCRKIESRYDQLKTLQYTVERTTELPRQKVKEKWIFRYQRPDHFRIDYIQPYERIIVVTGEDIWEFIPPANKAMHTDMSALSNKERRKTLTRALSRVVIDGLRIGETANIESRIIHAETDPKSGIMTLEMKDPPMTLQIDTGKEALRAYELRNKKGKLLMRTEADRFIEVAPSFWMPQRIRVTGGYKDEFLKSVNILKNIQIDTEIDSARFRFIPPAGTTVLEANQEK